MESSAIAVLVPPAMPQNGVMAAETPVAPGSDGAPSLFSRMLGGATVQSPQVASPETAGTPLATTAISLQLQLQLQLAASGGLQQTLPATTGNDVKLQQSDSGGLAALLAFQTAVATVPANGEIQQGSVLPVDGGKVPILQADTEVTLAVQESHEKPSGETEDAPGGATEGGGLLLASVMQLLSQPQTPMSSEPQKRSEAAATKAQVVPEAVPSGGASPAVAQTSVLSEIRQQVTVASAPATAVGTVEPATQVSAVAVAGISLDRKAPTAEPVGTDRETPAVDGEDRSAQALQLAGRSLKSLRDGHGPVSIQKGEAPAAETSGRVFNRPLLEVVVEGAETEQSTEVAATAKVDVTADAVAVGRPSHSLIGGAVGVKVEPAPLPAVAEAVRAPSHEQIMTQVKEQIGKAEFRADDGRVVLRLHPEELGSLRIDVKMEDQRLRLHIVAENPTVRDALVANMDSLKESLSKQQIVMERFDVATGQGQDQQQLFREHRQQVQDGQVPRPNRPATEYAEDGEVMNTQTKTAYWAPQEGGLLSVRF